MNIKKITIKNFRSIGDNPVEIEEPNKINLFVGKNNCGKTNLLRFIGILGTLGSNGSLSSMPYGGITGLPLTLSIDDHRDYLLSLSIEFSIYLEPTEAFTHLSSGIISSDNFFVTYELSKNGSNYKIKSIDSFITTIPEENIRAFESTFASKHGGISGGAIEQARERVARTLNITQEIKFPKVEYLTEYRKSTDNRELREKLNEIVNPDYTNQANITKKRLLCSYFASVFGFEVDIKIPSLEKEIELVINEKQTPLSSLGAGLQEVILIAFTIVTTDAEIICIDEPELHIHPGAQRELLNLVSTIEDKIFFFATHSNHFLDYEVSNKKVYQLIKDGDQTKLLSSDNDTQHKEILSDLGIRASEIYQTNGILWVEGPSDRIYIKKWIELISPEIQEGLQYTFQYYGGKVLSHYSLDDFEYEEYLNLLHINKNAFIVMDSDMLSTYEINDLRDTKKRLIAECTSNGIGYWVTKGKEMENYLSNRVLTEYSGLTINRDIYDYIGNYCSLFNSNKKVHFSREIANFLTPADIEGNEDLREKILEIISSIKSWNF